MFIPTAFGVQIQAKTGHHYCRCMVFCYMFVGFNVSPVVRRNFPSLPATERRCYRFEPRTRGDENRKQNMRCCVWRDPPCVPPAFLRQSLARNDNKPREPTRAQNPARNLFVVSFVANIVHSCPTRFTTRFAARIVVRKDTQLTLRG